jgi:hypothetical protein
VGKHSQQLPDQFNKWQAQLTSLPDLKACVLDLARVPAVAALGLLGDTLSGRGKVLDVEFVEPTIIPPLVNYLDLVEMNKKLPPE